jgi:hypothetical protein
MPLKPELFYSEYESDNLRKYLISAGYNLVIQKVALEPSVLFQMVKQQKKKSIDLI